MNKMTNTEHFYAWEDPFYPFKLKNKTNYVARYTGKLQNTIRTKDSNSRCRYDYIFCIGGNVDNNVHISRQ